MIATQVAPPRTEPEALFADVIVPRHLATDRSLHRAIVAPTHAAYGHRVLVPFGRSILQGAVIALSTSFLKVFDRARLKEISLVAPGRGRNRCGLEPVPALTAGGGTVCRAMGTMSQVGVASGTQATSAGQPLRTDGARAGVLAAREPCSVKARTLLTRLREKPSGVRRRSQSWSGQLVARSQVSRMGGGGPGPAVGLAGASRPTI